MPRNMRCINGPSPSLSARTVLGRVFDSGRYQDYLNYLKMFPAKCKVAYSTSFYKVCFIILFKVFSLLFDSMLSIFSISSQPILKSGGRVMTDRRDEITNEVNTKIDSLKWIKVSGGSHFWCQKTTGPCPLGVYNKSSLNDFHCYRAIQCYQGVKDYLVL